MWGIYIPVVVLKEEEKEKVSEREFTFSFSSVFQRELFTIHCPLGERSLNPLKPVALENTPIAAKFSSSTVFICACNTCGHAHRLNFPRVPYTMLFRYTIYCNFLVVFYCWSHASCRRHFGLLFFISVKLFFYNNINILALLRWQTTLYSTPR